MSLGSAVGSKSIATAIDAAVSVGKAVLHATAPDNFEYYLCSFELLDGTDSKKVGFMSFPVLPDSITQSHQTIQSIVKTQNGVVTTYNQSFAPVDINISGSFGRKLRILTDLKDPWNYKGKKFSTILNGSINIPGINVGVSLKTGYGLIKCLQHMLSGANGHLGGGKRRISSDNKKEFRPYFLIFNNYAFNQSFVVEVIGYSFSQSVGNNMIWNYNVQLKAVADANFFLGRKKSTLKQFLKAVATTTIANGLNKTINTMAGYAGL